jgi:hypothetical protein
MRDFEDFKARKKEHEDMMSGRKNDNTNFNR